MPAIMTAGSPASAQASATASMVSRASAMKAPTA